MKKVDGFLTVDGKYFDEEKDAELHERNLNFINWYGKLDSTERPSSSKPQSIANFIQNNGDAVLDLLNANVKGE